MNKDKIAEMARRMRADALTMAYCAGAKAAHMGGGLSHVDILAVLYGAVLKLDKTDPMWEDRDRFILSKGHGVLGYYAALCETGYISREELCTFERNNSSLLGHPVRNAEKGIEYTTGSLGQGLSIGIGVALSLKEQGKDSRVYVLMGDGECNEGSVWEGFMSAAQYKLDNITVIIDRNKYQLGGETEAIMDVGNMADKLAAFGWEVRKADGHNIEEIYEALSRPREEGRPLAIVADTIKGYGFSFSQGNNAWHHAVVTRDNYETGMRELGYEPEADKLSMLTESWEKENRDAGHGDGGTNNRVTEKNVYSIELTRQLARRWAMLGQRAAFGMAALELAKNNAKLKVLAADVSTSAGLDRLRRTCGGQYLDIGIAEQNMMGIAAGLSSMGYDVVTTSFAPFQSMRCLEQIRVNFGYMGEKAVMAGLASGLVFGTLGNTHCCFEDEGVLRSIPNIAIVSPADAGEVGKALAAALNYPESVYIRLMGGAGSPVIYTEDYEFEIGRAVKVKDTDAQSEVITIFASGTMVAESIQAAGLLEEKGENVRVINMHTIKPIDANAIREACRNSKLIVTAEEHNVYGGLGTAVAEVMAQMENPPKLCVIGLPDMYGHGGEYRDLLDRYGLTAEKIAARIQSEDVK